MLKIKGNKLLKGSIEVKGSKNSSLPIIIASLLNKGKVRLENVPNISDVNILIYILRYLNVDIEYKNNILEIDSSNIEYKSLLVDDVKKIRASSYFMGAFLSLFKKIEIFNPGGCNFSYRPIDYHLNGFKEFGVNIISENDLYLEANNIHNGYYFIPNISVGTTIDLLLFFSLNDNLFILDNIALEVEVMEVIEFLKLMGVEINKIKERTLLIKGKKELNKDIKYKIKNDRIEAGSLALLGAILGDHLEIKGFDLFSNLYLLNIFNKLNVPYKLNDDTLIISRFTDFKGIEIETNPYPLFPTDLQPLLTVFLSLGKEESIIKENIYPSRMSHINELNKLGFNLKVNNNYIIIKRMNKLKGNNLYCKDLRGGFSLLMASLLCEDVSTLYNEEFIKRGYEDIINRLISLGAIIYEEDYFN